MSVSLRDNISAITKNEREKKKRIRAVLLPSGKRCSIPTVNEVVAQRGIAKNGPIVKYRAEVKKIAKNGLTLLEREYSPSLLLAPSAATPSSGSPTPVITKPITAGRKFRPASCPM